MTSLLLWIALVVPMAVAAPVPDDTAEALPADVHAEQGWTRDGRVGHEQLTAHCETAVGVALDRQIGRDDAFAALDPLTGDQPIEQHALACEVPVVEAEPGRRDSCQVGRCVGHELELPAGRGFCCADLPRRLELDPAYAKQGPI